MKQIQIYKLLKKQSRELRINQSVEQNLIILLFFFGDTGTGKSSSIILLSGQQVFGYNDKSIPIINNLIGEDDKKALRQKLDIEEDAIFIEIEIDSGTVFPSYLPMKVQPTQQSIRLWDTPGFGDNKGITQVLVNTYYMHRLFELQEEVKLVYVINFQDINSSGKGHKFLNICKTLSRSLRNFKGYQKCIVLLITKCLTRTTEQDIKDLLNDCCQYVKKNINVIKNHEKDEVQKLVGFIQNKTIGFIIISQPIISSQTKNNPKIITNQYQPFRKQFYEVVTTKLKASAVPHLQSPGMSDNDIDTCSNYSKQVSNKFSKECEQLKNNLINHFKHTYFTSSHKYNNEEELKKCLQLLKISNNFRKRLQEIHKKSTFEMKQIQEVGTLLIQLKRFQLKNEDMPITSQPMQKFKNLLIISKFISSINIPQDKDISHINKLLFQLKRRIGQALNEINHENNHFLNVFRRQYQQFFLEKITQNSQSWENQRSYTEWSYLVKRMPYSIMKLTKYDESTKISQYLKNVEQIQKYWKTNCAKDAASLIDLHQFQDNQKILGIKQEQIVKRMKQQFFKKLSGLQEILQFRKWDKYELQRAQNTIVQNQTKQSTSLILNMILNDGIIQSLQKKNKELKDENDQLRRNCCQII